MDKKRERGEKETERGRKRKVLYSAFKLHGDLMRVSLFLPSSLILLISFSLFLLVLNHIFRAISHSMLMIMIEKLNFFRFPHSARKKDPT